MTRLDSSKWMGVEPDGSARSSSLGEFPSQVSTGHDCDKNVIPIVAKPGKSRKFGWDRGEILFSAICRKPLNSLAKRLLRQDLAN